MRRLLVLIIKNDRNRFPLKDFLKHYLQDLLMLFYLCIILSILLDNIKFKSIYFWAICVFQDSY